MEMYGIEHVIARYDISFRNHKDKIVRQKSNTQSNLSQTNVCLGLEQPDAIFFQGEKLKVYFLSLFKSQHMPWKNPPSFYVCKQIFVH